MNAKSLQQSWCQAMVVTLVALALVTACSTADYSEYSYGLPVVAKTGFDRLYVKQDATIDQVTLLPIKISYDHNRHNDVIYNDSDFELTDREVEKLQAQSEKAFAKYFNVRQDKAKSPDQGSEVYFLELQFDDLFLAAPLWEDPIVHRVFAENSGKMLLKGVIRTNDSQGTVVASFVDRVDIGLDRTGAAAQYSSVRFWSDMNNTLRRAAGKLQRSVN